MASPRLTNDPPAADRQRALDVARCIAIVLMVFAHCCDALLMQDEWATPLARAYKASLRGLTAPLFFVCSGWALALASKRAFELGQVSALDGRRLRRALLLGTWGTVLTVPWWATNFPFDVDAAYWEPARTFGVLHAIAASMLLAHLALRTAKSPRTFVWICLAVAFVGVATASFVQATAAVKSPLVRGVFYAGTLGGFPILPWASYFFVGCALGTLSFASKRFTARPWAWLLLFASVCFLARWPASYLWFGWVKRGYWEPNPGMFLDRVAIILALFGLLAAGERHLGPIARAVRTPSHHALTFYVGHMLLIWGVPLIHGAHAYFGGQLTFGECAAVAALFMTAIWSVVFAVDRLREWVSGADRDKALSAAGVSGG